MQHAKYAILPTVKVVDDEIPLRGVVKCHCGVPLTGAPSRGKSGKYFYYYNVSI